MNVIIDLTPDEERRLRERAGQLGQSPETYVRRLIRRDLEGSEPGGKSTFAEVLAPVHADFRQSGIGGQELNALLEDVLEESRSERRSKNDLRS